jgi:hypothetical protein
LPWVATVARCERMEGGEGPHAAPPEAAEHHPGPGHESNAEEK